MTEENVEMGEKKSESGSETEKLCSICGSKLTVADDYVEFRCPNCDEWLVRRCGRCKILSNPYKCEKCGFEGP